MNIAGLILQEGQILIQPGQRDLLAGTQLPELSEQ